MCKHLYICTVVHAMTLRAPLFSLSYVYGVWRFHCIYMYISVYQASCWSYCLIFPQAAQLRGIYYAMECEVVGYNTTQYILRTKCCAPATVMHWQLTSHLPWCKGSRERVNYREKHALFPRLRVTTLPIFSVLSAVGTASVCVFLQFSGMGFLPSTPNHLFTMHGQLQ